MQRIRESYQVFEAVSLDVAELQSTVFAQKRGQQQVLVLLSSLKNISEQSLLCKLRLYAYKCTETYKSEPVNNFYLSANNFYAHESFKNAQTAASVRREVEKIIKVANSSELITLLNPARMHLHTEEDLMVVLQLQEAPSVDISFDV